MRFVASLRNHIDALVHPSARSDALTAARHRAFIAPRLLGGFAALAAFTLLLAGLPILAQLAPSSGIALFEAFYRSGALVFGGGHVVLPLLREAVVAPGW